MMHRAPIFSCFLAISAAACLLGCGPQFKQIPTYLANRQLSEAICAVHAESSVKSSVPREALVKAKRSVIKAVAEKLKPQVRVKMLSEADLAPQLGPGAAIVLRQAVLLQLDFQHPKDPTLQIGLGHVTWLSERLLPEQRRWLFVGSEVADLATLTGEDAPTATVITEGGVSLPTRIADAIASAPGALMSGVSKALNVVTLGLVPHLFRRASSAPRNERRFVYPVTEREARQRAPLAATLRYDILKVTELAEAAPLRGRREVVLMRRPAEEQSAPLEMVLTLGFRSSDPQGLNPCVIPAYVRLKFADAQPLAGRIDQLFHGELRPLADFDFEVWAW